MPTIVFRNRLPLRTSADIYDIWLSHVDRDFGGRYIKYCSCRAGGYHVWYRFVTPYTDGTSYSDYLGTFTDYASLVHLLSDSTLPDRQKDQIIQDFAAEGVAKGTRDYATFVEPLGESRFSDSERGRIIKALAEAAIIEIPEE